MTRERLKEELDEVVEEQNNRKWSKSTSKYDYELNSHASGPAVDITKGGEPVDKVTAHFPQAAMRAGYVVTATFVSEGSNHTRMFLHEADEYFDTVSDEQLEDARAEGFAAGIFAATLWNSLFEAFE